VSQGMLALTFADASDYNRITGNSKVSIVGLSSFAPGKQLTMVVTPAGGASFEVKLNHTFNEEQIEWFKAGSALNLMKLKAAASK
jgi:aconitate hydratase